ncbi:hypothetical protein [uncultured Microscilla sp.]|uniref:hypothetical protein n=1 Tax=uncultured Microscilla sp. TaxID=432653 RepID=UPI002611D89D|nr:hypothetical protein [uncultured Microscilla sp.]
MINFQTFGKISDWILNSIVFNKTENRWYGVGADNTVSTMNNLAFQPWGDKILKGNWRLKMLTVDTKGTLWCVGTESNIGKWNGTGWDSPAEYGKNLKMIAFDDNNNMWCVTNNHIVAKWNGNAWEDQKELLIWAVAWIAFNPGSPNKIYVIGTEHNLGEFEFNQPGLGIQSIHTNIAFKSLTISSDGSKSHLYAINTDSSVCLAEI